ncbi:Protein SST2 [Wickerhamiella sorbophila]|uniref:Protein SST2 n=1 Tax=Wickerhamiella sorbophila TaxID=45607 RepID=A0A2T0FGJ3_9ASCO|nr:Protein SST2 [Wickerhamiella sorbophila]PRT54122.1 Protein SST2 [Wickerhamiella sorbophila]
MNSRDKIQATFSCLLIGLCELSEKNLGEAGLSFTVAQATKVLQSCFIKRTTGCVEQTTRIKISKHHSFLFLKEFVSLHLLFPSTIIGPLHQNSTLRPTAKGLALLHNFCTKNGTMTGPVCQLLQSLYNTLDLVVLPRDSQGNIKVSSGLVFTLWKKVLGEQPCVFDAKIHPDKVTGMGFHNVAGRYAKSLRKFEIPTPTGNSPYFKKYFNHPNSNALSQYWEASGVRLFSNLTFQGKKKNTRDYVVSGKALWQWIMDCTDVLSMKEAMTIVHLFLVNKLIRPIREEVCESVGFEDKLPLIVSRLTLYDITSLGRSVANWTHEMEVTHITANNLKIQRSPAKGTLDQKYVELLDLYFSGIHEADFETIASLKVLLGEPGLLILFKEWVCQQQSIEPLLFLEDFYNVKRYFSELQSMNPQTTSRGLQTLFKLAFQYIGADAPIGLNISTDETTNILAQLGNGPEILLRSLESVIHQQEEMLESLATRFTKEYSSEITPALKQYVVKQQLYYAVNVMMAEATLPKQKYV